VAFRTALENRLIGLREHNFGCCKRLAGWVVVVLGLTWAYAGMAVAQDPVLPPEDSQIKQSNQAPVKVEPVPLETDGPRYQVTKLDLVYEHDHADLPSLIQLGQVGMNLVLTETGYVAAREGLSAHYITISDIDKQMGQLPQYWFYASAVRSMAEAIVLHLNQRGLIGVFVGPDPDQIEDGEDERSSDDTSLRLVVRTVIVTESRTLASGERVAAAQRINHPVHRRIVARSPVQPQVYADSDATSLLRRDLLDEYLFRLNRLPGRRVDVAVSRSEEPGGVVLDYLVSENRPFLAYFQVSNTGTAQTDEWRERFGISISQFTDNDDTFSLDYVTSGFDESHSLVASYTAPVGESDKFRWRVFGSWGEYTATDVGAAEDQFLGDNWSYGGELIANVFQHREFFLDVILGVRQEQIFVDNQVTNQTARDDFFYGYFGFNLERIIEISSTLASITVERNYPGISNTEQSTIDDFGRVDPVKQWTLMKWNLTHSFYLEPLVNRKAWADVNTPDTSTLAHEVAMSFRGQHSFGARLIPQAQQVAGGLHSVRGYEESAVAADTVLLASIEYRYHLPRTFKLQPNPSKTPLFGKPFRFAPQQVYGRPDWDLILKAFLDAGFVTIADRVVGGGEDNERLIGAGVGIELQIERNINVQVDFGFALEEAGDVEDGSGQVHIAATILY